MNKEEYISSCLQYSMTNPRRMTALWDLCKKIKEDDIKGDFVECGVYMGGSSMLMAYAIDYFHIDANIYMFDTYQGMPEPGEKDIKINKGNQYKEKWANLKNDEYVDWCYASLEEVKRNMAKTNFSKDVYFIKGKVEDTIPSKINNQNLKDIALLRLDTDFYSSTKHTLKELYPKLKDGGYLVVDDYNCWAGAHESVNMYFKEHNLNIGDLVEVDHSCVYYRKGNN